MKPLALEIVRRLRERNFQAYLVGGCVRDLLLGREPADYDVATDATPEQVVKIFARTYAVGAQFGVVLVAAEGGEQEPARDRDEDAERPASGRATVEVATFRSDVGYGDGRHPREVRYTHDPAEDVQRRDFTINGMLLDPFAKDQILDFVGGRRDLAAGIIRAIGEPERRFHEDKLRMLRAIRFSARFRYTIEPATLAAIRSGAAYIHEVSRERARDELLKMLTEGRARRAFELLDESGLLQPVLPEIARMKGVAQPPQFHPEGDVWVHTLMLLEQLPAGARSTLALGALLHDVGKPPTFRVAPDRIRFDGHAEVGARMAEEICRRLRLPNQETERVVSLVAGHMKFPEVRRMRASTLKRFLRQPDFAEHLELHRLDCAASHGDLSLYEFCRQKLAEMPAQEMRPQPFITGDDLIAAGYQPGPQFKQALAAAEDAQLEGRIHDKEEALKLVRSEFPGSNKKSAPKERGRKTGNA